METNNTTPLAEKKLLNAGVCALISVSGSDLLPVQAARTSFRKSIQDYTEEQNDNLMDYLIRMKHDGPVEFPDAIFYVKAPIFVARQWFRHRIGCCLSGNSQISFELPCRLKEGYNEQRLFSLEYLYNNWIKSEYNRRRIQSMILRCVDESDNTLITSHISNIYSNGKKHVYRTYFKNGSMLECTKQHKCLTKYGWMTLEEALEINAEFMTSSKVERDKEVVPLSFIDSIVGEEWRKIQGYGGRYEVSNLGRIRSYSTTSYNGDVSNIPTIKRQSIVSSGYYVVNLSENGKSHVRTVHQLVLESFSKQKRKNEQETRHINSCRTDNRIDNLCWASSKENASDRKLKGSNKLSINYTSIIKSEYLGYINTYDIEVEGKYHNFFANNIVVHNSYNEESLRYIEPCKEFYIPSPEECKGKPKNAKQGAGDLLDEEDAQTAQDIISAIGGEAHSCYAQLARLGLANELSRTVLPLGQYTAFYFKINLRALFHFLGLRLNPHAQYQIRVYAMTMTEMLKPYFPVAFEAFENHILNAVTFSADEWKILKDLIISECGNTPFYSGGREEIWERFTNDSVENDSIVHGLRKTRITELIQKLNKQPIEIKGYK